MKNRYNEISATTNERDQRIPIGSLPTGVYFDVARKLWRCQWRENGKFKTKGFSLGQFDCLEDARRACILWRCYMGDIKVKPEWLIPIYAHPSLASKRHKEAYEIQSNLAAAIVAANDPNLIDIDRKNSIELTQEGIINATYNNQVMDMEQLNLLILKQKKLCEEYKAKIKYRSTKQDNDKNNKRIENYTDEYKTNEWIEDEDLYLIQNQEYTNDQQISTPTNSSKDIIVNTDIKMKLHDLNPQLNILKKIDKPIS